MTETMQESATLPPKTEQDIAEEPLATPSFDLSKKKKKKKPKETLDQTLDGADSDLVAEKMSAVNIEDTPGSTPQTQNEHPADFALPDFSGKKKKKKKKVFFEDDADMDGEMGGENGTSDRASRRDIPPQPWDGTDRDYNYTELINRAFQFLHGKNPALASGGSTRKKVSLQLPQVAREGTKKTVFLNFGAICKSIHRQQEHLLTYMSAELGTNGNIQEGGRLVIKGRFSPEGIANVLKRYMLEYVICTSCRSPDTVLMRDANTRLYFVSCESCGAKRSVAPIRQGFMAQVERRKKK